MYPLRKSDDFEMENKLKVFGKGVIKAKPDLAEVGIGVVTENQELLLAQRENARLTRNVINSLYSMGISDRFIQTGTYNVRPVYDYVEGKQVFRGYEVSNNLKVKVRNVNSVGQIIDTAVKNGANYVSGISFIVTDPTKYYYDALKLAVKDAQSKARTMANELNVKLNSVPMQIVEQDKGNIAPLTAMTLKSVSGATPIEAGENKITADIEAIFVYSD